MAGEAGLMGVPAEPVAACALSAAESVDDPVACFRSEEREKLDICPVHDNFDLQTCPAGEGLPIHPGGDVGLLRHNPTAAVENHKNVSASGVLSVLATAGAAVAMAEQPWNSGRRFLGV